jgi:predicted nucleic acid-binding protein
VTVLVDTCVLSEMARATPEPRVQIALSSFLTSQLFVSAITIGEFTKGVERLGQSKRRQALETWLRDVENYYADRILPVDLEVARTWGEITARAAKGGRSVPISDGLIAATAIKNGMHLMTRNTSDFSATGVLLIDPWQ